MRSPPLVVESCDATTSSGISSTFAKEPCGPLLFPCQGYVTHALLSRPPLNEPQLPTARPVRLACLSHAASVRSEPGSNSSRKFGQNGPKSASFRLELEHFAADENVRAKFVGFLPPHQRYGTDDNCCGSRRASPFAEGLHAGTFSRLRPLFTCQRSPALSSRAPYSNTFYLPCRPTCMLKTRRQRSF